MAGSFSTQDQHFFVSNKRFCALLEWAIEAAPRINDKKGKDYILKMQQNYQDIYSPCTDIDLSSELNKDEQVFWAKVFQVVGHQLFNRTLGSTESENWRPGAIADAVSVSRMLQKLSREYLDYNETNF